MRNLIIITLVSCVVILSGCGGGTSSVSRPTAVQRACIPKTYSGSGDDVINISASKACTIADITVAGDGFFEIRPYTGKNEPQVTLAYGTGPYQGTVKWNQEGHTLEIKADDRWQISVK